MFTSAMSFTRTGVPFCSATTTFSMSWSWKPGRARYPRSCVAVELDNPLIWPRLRALGWLTNVNFRTNIRRFPICLRELFLKRSGRIGSYQIDRTPVDGQRQGRRSPPWEICGKFADPALHE